MVVSILLEPKRKDFAEMFLHHIVSVVVLYISYTYSFCRVGIVIMVILDPADVPLHLAKVCKYIGETSEGSCAKRCPWCANRLFEVFAVVFFCHPARNVRLCRLVGMVR